MNKIEAIEKTIYNLVNDVYPYKWDESDKCNCGILATTLLNGKNVFDCGYLVASYNIGIVGVFSKRAYCMTTGIEIPEIFRVLKDAGFTHQDLLELEYLGNAEIGAKAGLIVSPFKCGANAAFGQYSIKANLIKYLQAWLSIFKDEVVAPAVIPAVQPPIERTRTVYVSVPTTMKEQTDTLILN